MNARIQFRNHKYYSLFKRYYFAFWVFLALHLSWRYSKVTAGDPGNFTCELALLCALGQSLRNRPRGLFLQYKIMLCYNYSICSIDGNVCFVYFKMWAYWCCLYSIYVLSLDSGESFLAAVSQTFRGMTILRLPIIQHSSHFTLMTVQLCCDVYQALWRTYGSIISLPLCKVIWNLWTGKKRTS